MVMNNRTSSRDNNLPEHCLTCSVELHKTIRNNLAEQTVRNIVLQVSSAIQSPIDAIIEKPCRLLFLKYHLIRDAQ